MLKIGKIIPVCMHSFVKIIYLFLKISVIVTTMKSIGFKMQIQNVPKSLNLRLPRISQKESFIN